MRPNLLKRNAFNQFRAHCLFHAMREFKSLPHATKSIDGRAVTGICAVFGNVDTVGDRIHPGAFTKTITEAGRQAKHLWGHDFSSPPIAAIKSLKEIGRDELPESVLALASDATGGLLVEREYLQTARGDEVLEGIRVGAINQMSFGFSPVKFDFATIGEGVDEVRVRELREVRLFDTSDVLWGMNEATAASKSLFARPLESIKQALEILAEEMKAGRRNNKSDLELINAIHAAAIALGCDVCAGILTAADEGEKSRADIFKSLTQISRELQALQLATI